MGRSTARSHSPYHPVKRARRAVLRRLGRWARSDYDVRIDLDNGQPTAKTIQFATIEQANSVADALAHFADSPHVPSLIERDGPRVSTEFVAGQICEPMSDSLVPDVARCLGHINSAGARECQLAGSSYWQAHIDRLDYLFQASIIDYTLYARLRDATENTAPGTLRIGFDYTDPIGQNLIQRSDQSLVAVIDVKNLRADQPAGLGMAKAASKWLTPERQPHFFEALAATDDAHVAHYFAFLCLFERVERSARKTKAEIQFRRWHKKTSQRRRHLQRLVDTIESPETP
ncbi:hypothetical protein [Salinisphaera orenii]|uniref:hypothetical protein n=1 Tax=Salinisphaera orenii TaxID=856731 RepID=UPI0013A6023B